MKFYKLFLVSTLLLFLSSCDKDPADPDSDDNNKNEIPGNSGGVGELSKQLVSADQFTSLEVEIQYAPGMKPEQGSLDNLRSFLEKHLEKPDGLNISSSEIQPASSPPYSLDEIRSIEEQNRTAYNEEGKVAAWFFFADGNYEEDGNENEGVLGIAYLSSSMCIFEKRIQELSGGISEPSTEKLESSVINHEFGHILGLVNNGTEMQSDHQDDGKGKHCDVEDCLMYWAVETDNFVDNLLGSSIPSLDSNCVNDVQALK